MQLFHFHTLFDMKRCYNIFIRLLSWLLNVWRFKKFGLGSIIRRPLLLQGVSNITIGKNVDVHYKTWLAAISLKNGNKCELVIGDGSIIGKPRDERDAEEILARLSGKTHRVLTAVAVADAQRIEHVLSISDVRFRTLDADEIARYVRSGEPMDKAGAYGIQGKAAMFIEEIRGSHSGIVGLPLCETALLLRRFDLAL